VSEAYTTNRKRLGSDGDMMYKVLAIGVYNPTTSRGGRCIFFWYKPRAHVKEYKLRACLDQIFRLELKGNEENREKN